MPDFRNSIELSALADTNATETALVAAIVALGWQEVSGGTISGETRSHVFTSDGTGNLFGDVAPGKESLVLELHYVSGEEWKVSTGIALVGAGPAYTSIVNRTDQESFYPKLNSSTEKTTLVSNGDPGTPPIRQYKFNGDYTDEQGNETLSTSGTVTLVAGDTGFGQAPNFLSSPSYAFATIVNANQNTFLPASGNWTISFRYKITSLSGARYDTLIHVTGAADANRLLLIFNLSTNDLRFLCTSDLAATDTFVSSSGINDTNWHTVNLVYDDTAGTITVYVDNVQKIQDSGHGGFVEAGDLKVNIGNQVAHLAAWQFLGVMDNLTVHNKKLTSDERISMQTDEAAIFSPERPTWTLIDSHNTTVNVGAGKHNIKFAGVPKRPDEPFITTLAAQATAGATTLTLTAAIWADLDPDQNSAAPQTIWLTDLTNGIQEQVTITSTPGALTAPTVSAITNTFPLGSLVSDFKYATYASDLLNDANIQHTPLVAQASLKQSFNENYEGTVIEIADAAGTTRIGSMPNLRGHGTAAALIQSDTHHHERPDQDGGFENRELVREASNMDLNKYSLTQGL